MHLDRSLPLVAALAPQNFDNITRRIDPEWVEQALQATGTVSVRTRRFPAELAIWLPIGMAMVRDRPIVEVVDSLGLVLPGADAKPTLVAASTVHQARARLGEEPLAWLFSRCADEWSHASAAAHRWRGLALYGVDGSTLRVADSDENGAYFGYGNGGHRGPSGYPLVRLVGLMALRSHLLAAASFGPYEHGEHTYARELWRSVSDNSLTIMDRLFFAAGVLIPLARDGHNRHWLVRAKKNLRWRTLQRLAPNDYLVEMDVSRQARSQDPSLPKTWVMRAIKYRRKGFRPETLLTSLLEAKEYPGDEIVLLYHERWELELGYDEIKTEVLEREETLRSKSPAGVAQEVWGILLAYNLVRLEIERVAAQVGVEPIRISFVGALRLIVDEWLWWSHMRHPGAIPSRLRNLEAVLKRLVLPPRRSQRSYPRAVKIKMSNYARKRRPSTGGGVK